MHQPLAEKQNAVFGWIFGGGFTFFGILFFTLGGLEFLQGLRTKQWPAAAGRIIESKITETPGTRNDYVVNVRYSYEVDGQKFEGNRMRHGTQSHRLSKAMDERALFPPGKEVQVYYDPTTPNRCVLIKGIGLSWLMMAIGLMALVLGLVVLFHIARARTAKII